MIVKTRVTLFLAIIFCLINYAKAQSTTSARTHFEQVRLGYYGFPTLEHKDSAEVLKNLYLNINGTPYLYDKWLTADIVTNNGNQYISVKAKYDVWNNLIETKMNNDSIETVNNIRRLFLAVDEKHHLLFENGFPVINGYNKNTLYQVLVNGSVKLLKKTGKKLSIQPVYNSGIPYKQLNDTQGYFVYKNEHLFELKRSKKAMGKLLPEKKEEIMAYINTNRIDLHNDNDLEKVIDYYNNL